MTRAWDRFWYSPAPLERLAVFRWAVYLYLPLDVLVTRWHWEHGLLPASWYAPLWIGRLLHIPAPTAAGMTAVLVAIVVLAPVAAFGKGRRTIGPALALLYFYWVYMGFAYGKVDHDRIGLLVALAVLPSVSGGYGGSTKRSGVTPHGDEQADAERLAGWALRCVQVAAVLTYFLAGVVKLRTSGPGWVTSAILVSAITRRGTMFADPLLNWSRFLWVVQGGIVAFELASPVMLLRNRLGRAYVGLALAFHLVTYAAITISFRPHLVCLAAFLPLEKLLRKPAEPVQPAQRAAALDHLREGDGLRNQGQRDQAAQQRQPAGAAEPVDGGGA